MSSSSQSASQPSTSPDMHYSQRYRDRLKQGHTPRHLSTPDEQRALLNRPYAELTKREKDRVRYYRRHARKEAHLLASRLTPDPKSISPSPLPPLSLSSPESHATTISTPPPHQSATPFHTAHRMITSSAPHPSMTATLPPVTSTTPQQQISHTPPMGVSALSTLTAAAELSSTGTVPSTPLSVSTRGPTTRTPCDITRDSSDLIHSYK